MLPSAILTCMPPACHFCPVICPAPQVSRQGFNRSAGLQVMSRAQLPLLTSVIMVTQAFISAPAGIRAKRSIKDRNQVLLIGYAAMIAADLTFAFLPTVYGEHPVRPLGMRLYVPDVQPRVLPSGKYALSCCKG